MQTRRALKFRGDQERRRFFVGVSVEAACRSITAILVAATGRALDARYEVASYVVEEVPATAVDLFERLVVGEGCSPADVAVLSAQLAEIQAAAISQLSAIESDVWGRVLLVGVTDPGLWRSNLLPPDYLGLCDSARLADLSGLNVIDGFPARDIVQDGNGRQLDALPLWLLLHHSQYNRLLVQTEPLPRVILLPGSRDESGADGIEVTPFASRAAICQWLHDSLQVSSDQPATEEDPRSVDELVLLDTETTALLPAWPTELRVVNAETIGIRGETLPAACAAMLAMLHIDQTPANLPYLTGATAERVLGRLTPGNAFAWNRLLRDLAFARPLVTTLRAAV
jgi:1,6-anhydro-N-acetylmuramate kinase